MTKENLFDSGVYLGIGKDQTIKNSIDPMPPQRTWVEIAPEEYPDICYQRESYYAGIKWAEARLKEKNA